MPLAATVPNSASPAPPSTGSGIDAMIAPSLGTSPSATRMMPLTATTKRLLMPVIATRPTFCANALTGKPLSRPPEIVVARVSARSPPTTVRPSAGRSITSPIARMSAVVSVMITSITMTIETIAAISNCGGPKWNGVDTANHWACPIRLKSTLPNGHATSVPSTRPARIATRLRKPGRNR